MVLSKINVKGMIVVPRVREWNKSNNVLEDMNWLKCLSIKLCQDFPSLAHLRVQQEDCSNEAVATEIHPAEPWAGFSAIYDGGKTLSCVVSSWRQGEDTERLVSRMEANVFLDLWRIAPSEDMAGQTIARMEKEDPGQMMCILLLEEVRKSGSIVRRLHNAIHRINRYPGSGKVLTKQTMLSTG